MKALVYTGTEKLEYKNFDNPNLKKDESYAKDLIFNIKSKYISES